MESQKLRRLVRCSILLSALVCFAMTFGCQRDQDRLRSLQQTNQALTQENQTLQQQNQTLTQKIQTLQQQNQALTAKAQGLEKQVDALKKTVAAHKRASVERKAPEAQRGAKRETARTATARGLYHQVRRGETLYQIGKIYGIPYQNIARVNNIRGPNKIRVGQKLLIPGATR